MTADGKQTNLCFQSVYRMINCSMHCLCTAHHVLSELTFELLLRY